MGKKQIKKDIQPTLTLTKTEVEEQLKLIKAENYELEVYIKSHEELLKEITLRKKLLKQKEDIEKALC